MRSIEDFTFVGDQAIQHTLFQPRDIDMQLHEIDASAKQMNPQFKHLARSVNLYLGEGTASLLGMQGVDHPAIRDENRNAIIPGLTAEISGRKYYFSIKGCGAHHDMFSGSPLTPGVLASACHDEVLAQRVKQLRDARGFFMGESWMGESPYGAQGEPNARDELALSMIASGSSLNGAYICPVIGIIPFPGQIEEMARKFFWFRQYPGHFYQEIRLVPSRTRLYLESPETLADPASVLARFHVDTPKLAQAFELKFIHSGFALLSLLLRSAREHGEEISGLVYKDVWLDKDAVVAPDGTIHFADLEGLDWYKIPRSSIENVRELQRKEWDKLFFEFLNALVQIDSFRLQLEESTITWPRQREGVALLIQLAIEKDPYMYTKVRGDDLVVIVETPTIPSIDALEIPVLQHTKI